MKKYLSLLIIAILMSMASAFAQGGTTGPLTWNLNAGTLTISGTGAMPNYDWGGAPWYPHAESIGAVVIENGVATIGSNAFVDCIYFASITMPNGVITIGNHAFYNCSALISITIPNSVISIGEQTFYNCSALISVTIGNSVKTIGDYAFYWCHALTSITIPNSVTSIGENAFGSCGALTSIDVENGNANYSSIDGVLFDKEKTILICFPAGKTNSSYTIPNSVTTIGNYAFNRCHALTSITIPNSVTSIGKNAFFNCSALISITIPNSVTTIGVDAFYGCPALTSIDVENGNANYSSMDGVLFDKEKTVLIYYPAGKTNSSYIVPNSVTTIGYSAFRSCFALASVTIPNSVITIGSDAFYWCTALASITIPNSVTVIGYSAFGFTALNSVTIPNSVTTIEGFAFAYCSALTSVTLGNGIVTIGGGAFYSCTALNSVINLNTEPIEISPYEFEGVNISACILKVPQNSVSAYQAAPVWQEFNIVGIQVYTVTLPTVTGATIAPSGGSSSPVEHGGSYSFTVTLATSHNQSTIVVKANGITLMPVGGVYTINNITANQTVTVEGVQINTYTITVTAGTGGTITPGTVIVSHGNSQTFEITPDEDYEIKDVFINGTSVGVVESYTFTDVQAEATIVANFEEKVGIGKFEPTNLKIYPNPTTGQLKIESEELKVENVEVFDVFGRTLLSQKFYMSPKTTINISHLTAGIYFLKVSTEAGQVIKKVLKK